ncbi:MAG TPA: GntR family transcriptional regulator [candidate division WOR-3 bacterium]|uniref:GntR family transcriptional regulator n=1 Tax=candidate division WOR-3 bacterium TaxID=2052148 RepID=A0A7C5DB86_UNCW3|nr:GntR family transcriptional regulator [candidate division WOR-3 bacterium]
MFKNNIPIYVQISDLIKKRIVRNEYMQVLPTVRELAMELNVNPNTVARAYRELERQGIIKTRVGSGTSVNSNKKENLKKELVMEAVENFLLALRELGLGSKTIKNLLEEVYDRDKESEKTISRD